MSNGLRWDAAFEASMQRLGRIQSATPQRVAGQRQVVGVSPAAIGVSKFGNVVTDGEASKRQAKRLSQLRLMNEAGQIRGLARQVEYVLIPKQTRECGELIERKVTYIADFVYEEWTRNGWHLVVEDCKGYATPAYVMKRKLMQRIHGLVIRET